MEIGIYREAFQRQLQKISRQYLLHFNRLFAQAFLFYDIKPYNILLNRPIILLLSHKVKRILLKHRREINYTEEFLYPLRSG